MAPDGYLILHEPTRSRVFVFYMRRLDPSSAPRCIPKCFFTVQKRFSSLHLNIGLFQKLLPTKSLYGYMILCSCSIRTLLPFLE